MPLHSVIYLQAHERVCRDHPCRHRRQFGAGSGMWMLQLWPPAATLLGPDATAPCTRTYPLCMCHSWSCRSIDRCFGRLTSVLAAIMPLAAAAGTPMPGMYESPHPYSPGSDVAGPGKEPVRAEIAGP
jgi:hypothetical protein